MPGIMNATADELLDVLELDFDDELLLELLELLELLLELLELLEDELLLLLLELLDLDELDKLLDDRELDDVLELELEAQLTQSAVTVRLSQNILLSG